MITYVFVHTLMIDLGIALGVSLYVYKTIKARKTLSTLERSINDWRS